MNFLKKEIIVHIFNYFGIDFRSQKITNEIILNDSFKLDEKIQVDGVDSSAQKFVWCSQLTFDSAVVRVILTDVSDVDDFDFALVFQMNNLNPYAIRLSSDPSDDGSFYVRTNDGTWNDTSTYIQSSFLSGFEGIANLMYAWDKSSDNSDLFNFLVEFLTTGDF